MPDVIEWLDDTGQEVVWRYSGRRRGEIQWGSQLVVAESQWAVFFRDGKAMDVFAAGRHTLTTANLPILSRVLGIVGFGGRSPFRADVYYVSRRVFPNLKWGTKEPITLRDPELAVVRLRGFGTFGVRVADPSLFLNTLVGTQGLVQQRDIEDYLRNLVVSRLSDIIGELAKSVFDLPQLYDEIGVAARARSGEDFQRYGLELTEFLIQNISLPEEVQKAIDERSSMAVVGDLGQYTRFQAAKAMREAAQSGGEAGTGVGLGAGIGLGAAMASQITQAMQQGQQPAVPDVEARLAKLKELFDKGLISEQEYTAKRQQILVEL